MNFEREHVLGRGDALVMLARTRRDARILDPGLIGAFDEDASFPQRSIDRRARRDVMVLGTGGKLSQVLQLLPDYLPDESKIMSELDFEPPAGRRAVMEEKGITLEAARVQGLRDFETPEDIEELEKCDTIVVMSSEDDRHRHDANILLALTALESHRERNLEDGKVRAHVIELLDAHNVELAEAFGNVSSLISPELVSNYLVQIANNPERGLVYRELLDIVGNEFYMVPLQRYLLSDDEDAPFSTLLERAVEVGEIAIGYTYSNAGEEHLRLCPHGIHRELGWRRLAREHDEKMRMLVVIAACYPELDACPRLAIENHSEPSPPEEE